MASVESIKGSPVGAFKHDLRERDVYHNEDIDPGQSHLNYILTPADHGTTSRDCMRYYEGLIDDVYHRGGSTICTSQIVISAPRDLQEGKEKEFFQSAYDFLNNKLFAGNDERSLLAVVHRDEIGQEHMHYLFTFPEVDNGKYVSLEEKCRVGTQWADKEYGLELDKEHIAKLIESATTYEKDRKRTRDSAAIARVRETTGLGRDDARKVFLRTHRRDVERCETRLMSKEEFLPKKFFDDLHPSFQKWIDDHGPQCTVYAGRGGSKINLTVEQLKTISQETGVKLKRAITAEDIGRLIKENIHLKERIKELETDRSREWGTSTGWGERTKERTW